MLIHESKQQVVVAGSTAGSDFFIANDPVIHQQLGEMMRNMYSDVPWALIREYVTNAMDADTHKQVRVTLPSYTSTELVIVDEGPGLGFQDLKFMLTGYGNSDKRGRKSQIGGFGIGAKCGMSYTDTFTYESVYFVNRRKWKTVMMCFMDDERKAKAKFTYHKLADAKAKTGITVRVPVARTDQHAFAKALAHFKYSPVLASRIVVESGATSEFTTEDNGTLKSVPLLHTLTTTVGAHSVKVHLQKEAYDYSYGNNLLSEITILLNGVPYPCTLDNVFTTAHRETWGHTCGWRHAAPKLILEFPPEAGIAPTPNREAIIVTPKAAALIVNTLDRVAREEGPDALWRAIDRNKYPGLFAWAIAGMRVQPPAAPVVPGRPVPPQNRSWVDEELKNVHRLMNTKFFGMSINGGFSFVMPKGWILIKTKGRTGLRLEAYTSPSSGIRDYVGTGTEFYPVRLADVPAKQMAAYKDKVTATDYKLNRDDYLMLLSHRLKRFFKEQNINEYQNPMPKAILLEHPDVEAADRDDLTGLKLADLASDVFTWAPWPRAKRQPKAPVAPVTDANGQVVAPPPPPPKPSYDCCVLKTRDSVEIPADCEKSDYCNSNSWPGSGAPYRWAASLHESWEQDAAKFLWGAATTPRVVKQFIPSDIANEKSGEKKSKLLWPQVTAAVKAHIASRPQAVQDWIKSQGHAYIFDTLWEETFLVSVRAHGASIDSDVFKQFLWLMTPADKAVGHRGITEKDAWIGKCLRHQDARSLFPASWFTADTTAPWQVKATGDVALDTVFVALLATKHPITDLMRIYARYLSEQDFSVDVIAQLEFTRDASTLLTSTWSAICKYK